MNKLILLAGAGVAAMFLFKQNVAPKLSIEQGMRNTQEANQEYISRNKRINYEVIF
jgi:hypothetical protein